MPPAPTSCHRREGPPRGGRPRKLVPGARIVAYGRHDNPEALEAARADGADVALPRSRFFQDPAAAVTFPG